jgi:hypothetical protein
MMFWTWFARSRKAKVAKAKGRPFRPALESLEARTVPDVNTLAMTLDSSQSSASVSGTVAGGNIQQQGAGSLTAHYSGSLTVNYDDGSASGTPSVQFVGSSSSVAAQDSGSWQPAVGGGSGSAPANYGAQATVLFVTARAAIRGLVVTADSSAVPLSASGMFASNVATVSTTAGTADYNAGSFGSGSASVAGQSGMNMATTQGTFTAGADGSYHLTAPLLFHLTGTLSGVSYDITLQGMIVANVQPVVTLGNGVRDFGTTFDSSSGNPVNIADPNAVITDAQPVTSLTVQAYNNPDAPNELLTADPNLLAALGLSQTYDPVAGTLVISGTASASAYTNVLRSITYQDTNVTDYSLRVFQVNATDAAGNTSPNSYSSVGII